MDLLNLDQIIADAQTLLVTANWSGAREILQEAVKTFPDQASPKFLLGIALHGLGERPDAIKFFRDAIEIAPAFTPALNALAIVLAEEGQYIEALDAIDRALGLVPADAKALHNRGVVLEKMSRHEAALQAYDQAIAGDPGYEPSLLNRGAVLMTLGQFEAAVENNRRLVVLQPNSADAHFNLSEALLGLGRSEEALAACERAITLDPRHAKANIDRGLALADLGRFDDAQQAFHTAEAIEPGAVRAYLDRIAPADPALARSLDPRLFFLYRGHERLMRCDWSMRDLYVEYLTKLIRTFSDADQQPIDLPLAYHSLTVPVPQDVPYRIACAIGERYADAVSQIGIRFGHKRHLGRIRIGYLSADYCEHLNAYLSYPLFRLHDRSKFEVFAYSIGPDDQSNIRGRICRSADRFSELSGISDIEAARSINGDGVDILVDFGGYTQHCRPGIPALRPAPLQLAYIGFPGTMGASWIDYRLTDHIATPAEQERFWREQLIFLPDTFFIYDRFEPLPDLSVTRAQYGLPEDAFVFCALNNLYKIEPEIFGVWMEILKAVPSSVLWLIGKNVNATANLLREAQRRGVAAERLVFAPLEERDRYRSRYRLADLFLDTPVFNAMTTACDALAAGLPLLTITGQSFPSRVAASLLSAAGFREGIADSLEGYRERAINWGNNPSSLADLGRRQLANPLATPLFDTEGRVRQLERAYEEMWRRHNLGLPPESFDVVAQAPAWRNLWH